MCEFVTATDAARGPSETLTDPNIMSLQESYEQLKSLVNEADDDVKKAAGGNKAAGTRVRKKLQEVKNHATQMRAAVLESRSEE